MLKLVPFAVILAALTAEAALDKLPLTFEPNHGQVSGQASSTNFTGPTMRRQALRWTWP